MKRFIIGTITTVVLALIITAGALYYYTVPSETEDPEIIKETSADFIKENIYVDGRVVYNWALENPAVAANGTAYIPMDLSGMVAGSDNPFEGVKLLLDAKASSAGHEFKGLSGTFGYKSLESVALYDTEDIFISEEGVVYGSARFVKDRLGIDAFFSPKGVLYLSTDPNVSAKRWEEADTNISYSEGVAVYMRTLNRKLSKETAAEYEYLMRHVAGQYQYITPELLFGVIRTESNFNAKIGKSAVGLMQALLKYAKRKGYTREMLEDPHINLEYGASYLNSLIKMFKGDVVPGLVSYNRGPALVKGRKNYPKTYSNVVLRRVDALKLWLEKHGYSSEYKEQLVLTDVEFSYPIGE